MHNPPNPSNTTGSKHLQLSLSNKLIVPSLNETQEKILPQLLNTAGAKHLQLSLPKEILPQLLNMAGSGTLSESVHSPMTLSMTQPNISLRDNLAGFNGPTALDYKKYDQRTHVYMKPDMYIGADTPMVRHEWLFDIKNNKMINSEISFVPGCEKLFLELLSN